MHRPYCVVVQCRSNVLQIPVNALEPLSPARPGLISYVNKRVIYRYAQSMQDAKNETACHIFINRIINRKTRSLSLLKLFCSAFEEHAYDICILKSHGHIEYVISLMHHIFHTLVAFLEGPC